MLNRYSLAALTLLAVSVEVNGEENPSIQGTWVMTMQESALGRARVLVEGGGVITNTFDGNKFTETCGKGPSSQGTFRIGISMQPNAIDLVLDPDPRLPEFVQPPKFDPAPGTLPSPELPERPETTTIKCLYKIEKDTLKLAWGLKQRPKDFVPGEDVVIFEFERQK